MTGMKENCPKHFLCLPFSYPLYLSLCSSLYTFSSLFISIFLSLSFSLQGLSVEICDDEDDEEILIAALSPSHFVYLH